VARINSVLGPLDTKALGFTLSYEHVAVSSAGIRHVYHDFIGPRNTIVANAVRILREAKAGGVDTIVDSPPLTSDATSASSAKSPAAAA